MLDETGSLRPDAAVNAGNTLCSLAELYATPKGPEGSGVGSSASSSTTTQDPQAALHACQLFEQARQLYQGALQAGQQRGGDADAEEDADTWSNLADCLVAYAQLLAEGPLETRRAEAEGVCQAALQVWDRGGRRGGGELVWGRGGRGGDEQVLLQVLLQPGSCYPDWKLSSPPLPPPLLGIRALLHPSSQAPCRLPPLRCPPPSASLTTPPQAYERSCALSDSAHGDDLPGLLCNWGCGLLAVAQMTHPAQVRGGWVLWVHLLDQDAPQLLSPHPSRTSSSFAVLCT